MAYEPEYVFEQVDIGWLLYPQSMDLKENLIEGVGDEAQWYGGALFVEPRHGYNFACQLREEGFIVKFPWSQYETEDSEEEEIL